MTDTFVKSYAAIKGQLVSDDNILDEYFPYIATIVLDENMEVINVDRIAAKLSEKYDVQFQPTFINQIISNAMPKGAIKVARGNYVANKEELRKYYISDRNFDSSWRALLSDFIKYAKKRKYDCPRDKLEDYISSFIDAYDDRVIFNHIEDINFKDHKENPFLYHWCNYILYISSCNNALYSFVVGLCMANIVKSTLFYTGKNGQNKVDLEVYLDTPMIFALLGMDTPERKKAYQYVVEKAKKCGISLYVFDHNLVEVEGIINNAINWVNRTDYDMAKANKVAQYFRESGMSAAEMTERAYRIERDLNEMGITVKETDYYENENRYQADEAWLNDAIINEYGERSMRGNENFESSVRTDVRSIVMVERKRRGTTSTMLKTAKTLFITTNGAIAKVSKDLMCRREQTKNKIPPCITSDIFGTLLWLDFPEENSRYQSLKLLADCKSMLTASPEMVEKFKKQLEEAYAKKDEDLTEDMFLVLRTAPIVRQKLLDATTGDYAQFTDQTWRDVYDRIMAEARYSTEIKYKAEMLEHEKTKSELNAIKQEQIEENKRVRHLEEQIEQQRNQHEQELNEMNAQHQQKLEEKIDKIADRISTIIRWLVFGIPYFLMLVAIVFVQNALGTPTKMNIIIVGVTVLLPLLADNKYKKVKPAIKEKIKKKIRDIIR